MKTIKPKNLERPHPHAFTGWGQHGVAWESEEQAGEVLP